MLAQQTKIEEILNELIDRVDAERKSLGRDAYRRYPISAIKKFDFSQHHKDFRSPSVVLVRDIQWFMAAFSSSIDGREERKRFVDCLYKRFVSIVRNLRKLELELLAMPRENAAIQEIPIDLSDALVTLYISFSAIVDFLTVEIVKVHNLSSEPKIEATASYVNLIRDDFLEILEDEQLTELMRAEKSWLSDAKGKIRNSAAHGAVPSPYMTLPLHPTGMNFEIQDMVERLRSSILDGSYELREGLKQDYFAAFRAPNLVLYPAISSVDTSGFQSSLSVVRSDFFNFSWLCISLIRHLFSHFELRRREIVPVEGLLQGFMPDHIDIEFGCVEMNSGYTLQGFSKDDEVRFIHHEDGSIEIVSEPKT